MSQSFFLGGFPLHTFSLINLIFFLSTHHLPIKQIANVYTINEFPLNPNFLKFNNQSFSLSLWLFISLSNKWLLSLPKTFNCFPLDLKPIDLIFLYIDFELLSFHPISHQITTRIWKSIWDQFFFFFPWTSLLFYCNFYGLYWIFFSEVVNTMFLFSFLNFQLIVYFFVFIFTIFLYIIVFYPLKLFMPKELECVLLI